VAGKTLENNGTVALAEYSSGSSVVLTTADSATTGGASITGSGTLTVQGLEISGPWTANLSDGTGSATTVAIASASGKTTITGGTSSVLKGGARATIKQSAGSGKNVLELAATTVIDLGAEGDGSLVLTGGADNGAILQGEGSVVAGDTEIVGDTAGWQAVGTGNITIRADTITGAPGVELTAKGANAVITVAAGGTLSLAASTTINLAGDDTAAGKIVLKEKGSGSAAGTISLPVDTLIKARDGAETGSATTAQLQTGLGGTVTAVSGKTTVDGGAGKLTQIIGAEGGSIVGKDSGDVTIASDVAITSS
jgi:hypothetical protein